MKSGTSPLPPLQSTKVLDQLRERIRYFHYSIRTEEVYVYWVRLFIRFHRLRHPASMGGPEVEAFLSWLASTKNVAALQFFQCPFFRIGVGPPCFRHGFVVTII